LDSLSENVPDYTHRYTINAAGKGNATIDVNCFYMGENQYGKWYSTEYRIESVSYGEVKVADHVVESTVNFNDPNMVLQDSKPDSTYTMSSVTVQTSFSLYDVGTSVSWTYSTPICKIHNESVTSQAFYRLWFDIDENNCYANEVTRPGNMVRTTSDGYDVTETVSITFATPYHGMWPRDPQFTLNTYSVYKSTQFTV